MKLAFLGTSEFAVPALRALVDAGHDVIAVYTRAPKPAGRGQQERRTPVHRPGARARPAGAHARKPPRAKKKPQAFKALDLDAAVVVVVRPHPAQELPRRAGPGLHQHPRLAAAALARRGADPARHPGRRRARPASPSCAWTKGSTPARCCWPSARRFPPPTPPSRARPAGRTRRAADRVDARRAAAPGRSSRCRSPRKASPTPTSSTRRKARSTGAGPPPSSSARCAPSIRGPAPRSSCNGRAHQGA